MTTILQINSSELHDVVKRCFLESITELKNLSPQVEQSDRLTIDEAIEITGLRRSVIYKMTCEKAIPFSKYGKRLVFSRRDLLAWVESRTIKTLDTEGTMCNQLAKVANQKAS
jgi:excisionase family DNA binding protein